MRRKFVTIVAQACSLAWLAAILSVSCGKVIEKYTVIYPDGGVLDSSAGNGGSGPDDSGPSDSGSSDSSPDQPKCATGPCCSGDQFASKITVCASSAEYQCTTSQCGGARQQRAIRQYCSGTSAGCDGATQVDAWQEIATCASDEICVDQAGAEPLCSRCPSGCDSNTQLCKQTSKLWLFKTPGATFGNAFGGQDTPANVRGGADGRCLASYTAWYSARQCNPENVHAILYVSATDSVQTMLATYKIPGDVPLHRADDDVLVADTWQDLIGLGTILAPPTTAATDDDGIVWTGADGHDTCKNWTSKASTDFGTLGYTNRASPFWIFEKSMPCNLLADLMCVCW